MLNKRGKNWWLDIWVGHGKARKRVRRSLKTDERALAIDRARDIERELREGVHAGLPFSELKEKYLAWARDTKPSSARDDGYHAGILARYFETEGISTIEEITPYIIERMRIWLRAKDRRAKPDGPLKDKPSARSTVNRYCALLRAMINKARDWDLFAGPNPVSKVKFYREPQEIDALGPVELEAVMKACLTIATAPESPIQRAIHDLAILAVNTGLRKSEALHLRWRDVRDEEVIVYGKGGKRRVVPLNAAARAAIEHYIIPHSGVFVFNLPNRDQPGILHRTVKRIRTLSGVPGFHWHRFRHTFTTSLLGAGVDIQTIAELLGHSRISTALLYSHSSPDRKRRAVDMLMGQGIKDVQDSLS
jgi:integrase